MFMHVNWQSNIEMYTCIQQCLETKTIAVNPYLTVFASSVNRLLGVTSLPISSKT